MIIIIADVDEVAALHDMDETRQPENVRPQTSSPCVYYGPYGCEVPREDGQCPHLDNASIVCPIKDVLGAAQAYAGDQVPVTQCDEDPVFAVPRPAYRPGDRVRIVHPLHRGQTGEIQRRFPATDNYLVAIDGLPDKIILRDKDLEVEA